MKASRAAVKPYARALHDVAKERQQTEPVGRDLEAFVAVVEREKELRDFFGRPWIATAVKRAAAMDIATRLGLSPLVRDFVGLVAAHGRAPHLDAIAVAYRDMVDGDLGRVRARVRTAIPLTDAERDALRARLGQAMGAREVLVQEEVDAKLLGGFIAEIGTYIVDGSLDGQLARIEERLVKGSAR
jgi:F-type H+-transporting ATPase subunit delta